ncbi:MAG: glycosyltransferase family 39 protein [Kiritimatiellia bacterium]
MPTYEDDYDASVGRRRFRVQGGMQVIAIAILSLCALALWAFFQFEGLRSPAVMEQAAVARNLASGRGFVTHVVRPFDLWMIGMSEEATTGPIPVLWHAPFYPYVLAGAYRLVRPAYAFSLSGLMDAEVRVMVPLSILLLLLTAWAIWSLARHLYDERVARLSAAVFLVSPLSLQLVLETGAMPLAMVLAALLGLLAWKAVASSLAPNRQWMVLLYTVCAGITGGLVVLTDYRAILLALGIVVFLGVNLQRHRWLWVGLYSVMVLAVLLPWVLSQRAYGWWGVMAYPYGALLETTAFPADTLLRDPEPVLRNWQVALGIREGLAQRCAMLLDGRSLLAAGFVLVFFLVSLFQSDEHHWNRYLKWIVVVLFVLSPVFPMIPGASHGVWAIVFPFMVLFGVQAFCALLEKEEFFDPSAKPILTGLFVVLCLLPSGTRLLQRGAERPYPPYHGSLQAYVGHWVQPEQVLVTDIPWATAWYGGQVSLLWPNLAEDVLRYGETVGAIYLAGTESGRVVDPVWQRMRFDAVVPEGYPYVSGMFLPTGQREQILLLRAARTDQE